MRVNRRCSTASTTRALPLLSAPWLSARRGMLLLVRAFLFRLIFPHTNYLRYRHRARLHKRAAPNLFSQSPNPIPSTSTVSIPILFRLYSKDWRNLWPLARLHHITIFNRSMPDECHTYPTSSRNTHTTSILALSPSNLRPFALTSSPAVLHLLATPSPSFPGPPLSTSNLSAPLLPLPRYLSCPVPLRSS